MEYEARDLARGRIRSHASPFSTGNYVCYLFHNNFQMLRNNTSCFLKNNVLINNKNYFDYEFSLYFDYTRVEIITDCLLEN